MPCRRAFCLAALLAILAAPARAGLGKEDKAWLDEVKILLLPTEREIFESLKGDRDRAEFKRIFWGRRDPDLSTPENEFKLRYDARRVEADERFHTGTVRRIPRASDFRDVKPGGGAPSAREVREMAEALEHRQTRDMAERDAVEGSHTDCGRFYIVLGDPAEVRELNMTVWGDRKPQVWVYPALNSRFQFDESCSLAPWAHNLRSRLAESTVVQPNIGYHVEAGRITRTLESMLPRSSPVLALIRETRRDFDLSGQTAFLKIADGATGVMGLLKGDASSLAFQAGSGPRQVRVGLRAVVQKEEGGSVTLPDREVTAVVAPDGSFVASYRIHLRPGQYTLKVGVLEPLSGRGSVVAEPLTVPDFNTGELTVGSVLVLEDVTPSTKEDPAHPLSGFVLGDSQFVPRFGNAFRRSEAVLVSYQYYDPRPDPATGKPRSSAKVTVLTAEGRPLAETPDEEYDTPVAGTVVGPIPLAGYAPGRYRVRVTVTDKVAQKAHTQESYFEVLEDAPPAPAVGPSG